MATQTSHSLPAGEENLYLDSNSAVAARAVAIGAGAVGALAVGAMAIGALAIGRLAVRKARIGSLDIGELRVRAIHQQTAGGVVDTVPAASDSETRDVANAYVAMCREGRFEDAMEQLFSPNHVRVEALDTNEPPVETHGLPAIKKRSREFADETRVHGFTVDGPFVGDDRFAVRFTIDATVAATGERATIPKMDLYTVRRRRIVRSEVFYQDPSLPHG